MRNFQSLRYREFCFRVYRSAALLAKWFRVRGGFYRLDDAIYWFLPLNLCKVGYEVWKHQHTEDFIKNVMAGRSL